MRRTNSLDVPERYPCAFCEYLTGARPYTVLERGPHASILVTREQRGLGHVLVIPTAHRETILDLDVTESPAVIDAVIRSARAIERAFGQPGLAIWQNNGLPANQQIPHVHFHVSATHGEDETERGDVPELSVEETEAVADRLRPHLKPPSFT